jgi:hypothetical protein
MPVFRPKTRQAKKEHRSPSIHPRQQAAGDDVFDLDLAALVTSGANDGASPSHASDGANPKSGAHPNATARPKNKVGPNG